MTTPITPQPTPFTFTFSDALATNGQKIVVVSIYTVTGTTQLFMTPEDGETIAEQWLAVSKQCKSGLILPQTNVKINEEIIKTALEGRSN